MKTLPLLSLLAAGALTGLASAATVGVWSASGGATPGTDLWSQDLSGSGGWFQGNSGANAGGSGAGAGNPAWGFWSNAGGTSAGVWTLVGGAMTVGQELSINFDNGWVNSGGVGVQFRSGSSLALAVFYNSGFGDYQIFNSTGNITSSQGWTGNGFTVTVGLGLGGTYNLGFLGYSGSGTLGNSQTSIDNIRVYTWDPTNGSSDPNNFDVFANNVTVVPEATTALLGAFGVLGLLRRRR